MAGLVSVSSSFESDGDQQEVNKSIYRMNISGVMELPASGVPGFTYLNFFPCKQSTKPSKSRSVLEHNPMDLTKVYTQNKKFTSAL